MLIIRPFKRIMRKVSLKFVRNKTGQSIIAPLACFVAIFYGVAMRAQLRMDQSPDHSAPLVPDVGLDMNLPS
jgi:hypothetical protein